MRKPLERSTKFFDCAHPVRHIESKFHHLEDAAPIINDRIIGSLNENAFAILAKAHELPGREVALSEFLPEIPIVLRLGIGRLAEHLMMLTDQLFRRVTERREEILVGAEDFPVGRKFDHGLRAGKRCQLAVILGALALDRGDVGCNLDHLVRFTETKHRIVRSLNPDFVAILGLTPVLALIVFAARQLCPEGFVFRRSRIFGRKEHAVGAPNDFRLLITHSLAEIIVRFQNLAGQIELDDGLRAAERIKHRISVQTEFRKVRHLF
ncbi:hypothetical protein D3C87_990520 [compost metagenome]